MTEDELERLVVDVAMQIHREARKFLESLAEKKNQRRNDSRQGAKIAKKNRSLTVSDSSLAILASWREKF